MTETQEEPKPLDKYVELEPSTYVVGGERKPSMIDQINQHAELGYRVHTRYPDYALMSLQSSKYDGITHLEDVPPDEAQERLEHGWTVLETYSKFIRMVKRA